MKLIGAAIVKNKISGLGVLKKKIIGSGRLKSLAPEIVACTPYNLIDGGFPGTVYEDINGFNLIDGGAL
jgi:hypothetical protein